MDGYDVEPCHSLPKISAGCDNCYAARFSERFRGVPDHPFETGFDLTLRPERLSQPLGWKRPRMILVNSMSDLFHKDIPKAHIAAVFDTMEKADWHIYQVLTKPSSLLKAALGGRRQSQELPSRKALRTRQSTRTSDAARPPRGPIPSETRLAAG
jgi:protein gp37